MFMKNYMMEKMNQELRRLVQQEEVLVMQKNAEIDEIKRILLKSSSKRT